MHEDHITMAPNWGLVIPATIRNQIGMPQGGSFVIFALYPERIEANLT
jgi:hypothetical protein